VTFVTPSAARGGAEHWQWADAAAAAETAVVYMGALQAERVADALVARGVPGGRPVALIENASSANERIFTGVLRELPALAAHLGEGPALIIIGEAFAEARAVIAEAA
jgi:siroheme synthase